MQAHQGQKKSLTGGKKSNLWTGSGWEEEENKWNQGNSTGSGWPKISGGTHNTESQGIGTWENPSEGAWRSESSQAKHNDIIVDTQDKEAWPSIGNQCDSDACDTDNASSVNSGSVIASSNNTGHRDHSGRGLGISAIHGQGQATRASNVWGGSFSTNSSEQSESTTSVWSNSSSGASLNSQNNISSALNNQETINMQANPNTSRSDSMNRLQSSSSSSSEIGWGMNLGSQNSMQQDPSGGSCASSDIMGPSACSGAQGDNNGPQMDGVGAGSHPAGICSALMQGLRDVANQDTSWSMPDSNSNSVIDSGLSISTSATSVNPMDTKNTSSMSSHWGTGAGNSSNVGVSGGWGNQSEYQKLAKSSGWGSPNSSPLANAGTEGWAQSKPAPSSAWGQPAQSWGQSDSKNNPQGWRQPETKQNASGWNNTPEPKPPGNPGWGPPTSQPATSAWGAPGEKAPQQSQWGLSGGGAANPPPPPQWSGNPQHNNPQGAWSGGNPISNPNPPPPPKPANEPAQSMAGTWAQAATRGINPPNNSANKPESQANFTSTAVNPAPGSRPLSRDELIERAVNTMDSWGKTPIQQDTAWDLEKSPRCQRKNLTAKVEESNHWHQPNDGTAIWESTKQNSNSNNSANYRGATGSGNASVSGGDRNSSSNDNDGGNWVGPPDNTNVWTGPPPPVNSNNWGSGNNPGSGNPSWGANERPGSWGSGSGDRNSGNWGNGDKNCSPGYGDKPWTGGGNGEKSWGGSGQEKPWEDVKPEAKWNNVKKDDNMWDRDGTNHWGESGKMETGTWSDRGSHSGRSSSSSWGDDENNWPNGARRDPEKGLDDGTAYWGDPASMGQNRPQPNWSGPSTPTTPHTPHTPQPITGQRPKDDKPTSVWGPPQQPPPKPAGHAGWGDGIPNKGDEGPNWAQSHMQQKPGGGWGDGMWPPGGAKPKATPVPNWEGGYSMNMGKPPMPGANSYGAIGKPQMRSQMLQHLVSYGFKKEAALNALIANNMNIESAIADLYAGAAGKRPDFDAPDASKYRQLRGAVNEDMVPDTHGDDKQTMPPMLTQNTPFSNAQPSPHMNSHIIANQMKQGPSLQMPSSLSGLNNTSITPSIQQKLLQQQQHHIGGRQVLQGQPFRGQPSNSQNALQQQIVQQLQMAVQAGLISPTLLNQQLSPNMLVMLQQLLQLQQVLQRLVAQQQLIPQNTSLSQIQKRQQLEQLTVTIQKIKQQIQQQQLLITTAQQQQALAKQQTPTMAAATTAVDHKDMLTEINTEMSHLQMKEDPGATSRLSKWKLPSPEKDSGGPDLNRAPGSNKPPQPLLPHSTSVNTSLPFSDSTWSIGSTTSTSTWPTTSAIATSGASAINPSFESKGNPNIEPESPLGENAHVPNPDDPDAPPNPNLDIEEFVPGKKWQGTTRRIEDDPHITPGEVAGRLGVDRIKDDYVAKTLSNQSSASPISSIDPGVTSSAWPMTSGFPKSSSSTNLAGGSRPSSWNSPPSSESGEIWGVPVVPKNTRPPPGLQKNNWPAGINRSQSWAPGERSAFQSMGSSSWSGQTVSNWLLLKNLTPQIDGSTLKTLCLQHGPLQTFMLSLIHGYALVSYNTREEAIKAQKSLNTCLLNNTTILAEFVSENDVKGIVEQNQQRSHLSSMQQQQQHQPQHQHQHQHQQQQQQQQQTNWSSPPVHAMPTPSYHRSESAHWNGSSTIMWSGGSNPWTPSLDDHTFLPVGDLLGGH